MSVSNGREFFRNFTRTEKKIEKLISKRFSRALCVDNEIVIAVIRTRVVYEISSFICPSDSPTKRIIINVISSPVDRKYQREIRNGTAGRSIFIYIQSHNRCVIYTVIYISEKMFVKKWNAIIERENENETASRARNTVSRLRFKNFKSVGRFVSWPPPRIKAIRISEAGVRSYGNVGETVVVCNGRTPYVYRKLESDVAPGINACVRYRNVLPRGGTRSIRRWSDVSIWNHAQGTRGGPVASL